MRHVCRSVKLRHLIGAAQHSELQSHGALTNDKFTELLRQMDGRTRNETLNRKFAQCNISRREMSEQSLLDPPPPLTLEQNCGNSLAQSSTAKHVYVIV
jgi:hypothetical protein